MRSFERICVQSTFAVRLSIYYTIIDFSYFTLNLREHSIKLIITKLFCMLAISIYKVNTIVGKKANYTCGVARVCCAYMYVYTAIYNLALNVHMWCFFFAICNMPMRQRGKIVFSTPSICFFF